MDELWRMARPASAGAAVAPRRAIGHLPSFGTRRSGSGGGELFLDDDPAVVLGVHHAAAFQVLHDAADHFARSANHFGEILTRNLVADDLQLAVDLRHVEQG